MAAFNEYYDPVANHLSRSLSSISSGPNNQSINSGITYSLQKVDLQRNLEALTSGLRGSPEKISATDLDTTKLLGLENRSYNLPIGTENPFKDLLNDTQDAPTPKLETPAAIIERRVERKQWLHELEIRELKALAIQVQKEAAQKGYTVEINKDFEIISVKPIAKR